ncbi:hypothetical protein FO519_009300 [Halicephalobus sp. NKZ332]|nr:hypothetical protein FO519_009300 [Halicephalobus sp. NKZ332]
MVELDIVKLLPGHTYISPGYDLLLRFDTDETIRQAGFELVVQEYDCKFDSYTWEMEPECDSSPDFIVIHYNITQDPIITAKVITCSSNDLMYTRVVTCINCTIEIHTDEFMSIMDVTNIWLSMELSWIPTPKLIDTLILNDTAKYILYDLTQITDNSYVQIHNRISERTIDCFFVTDSDFGTLDFYGEFFDAYMTPVEKSDENQYAIKQRRFMPKGMNLPCDSYLVYSEKKDMNYSVFMFVKFHNLRVSNCLFEHDVIDVKLLSEANGTLTMANNGTGPCIVTLLNPFREKRVYLDDFWTDAVSDPIEVHDDKELLFNFTKFDKVEKFYLEKNFYRFILPVGTSFTVTGHDDKPK